MKEKVSLLDTVPHHAPHIQTECDENGLVTLSWQRFPNQWLTRILSKWYSPSIRVPLEQIGSAVWQQIDGKRKAEEVIREVAMQFPDEENLPQRIAMYLSKLHQDGFIIVRDYGEW